MRIRSCLWSEFNQPAPEGRSDKLWPPSPPSSLARSAMPLAAVAFPDRAIRARQAGSWVWISDKRLILRPIQRYTRVHYDEFVLMPSLRIQPVKRAVHLTFVDSSRKEHHGFHQARLQAG